MIDLVESLASSGDLTDEQFSQLLATETKDIQVTLMQAGVAKRNEIYGPRVFFRGLIELSSYCFQNCLYCGIRKGNKKADRYRLSPGEIMDICRQAYEFGFRTFVLQGGEDPFYMGDQMANLIEKIKKNFPQVAVTLSVGELSYEMYQRFYNAGADRYLLRHETASASLYQKLHPKMDWEKRIECLYMLKEIGYQVGAGFMVGLPGQKMVDYLADIRLLQKIKPEMVGIGPFIPHHETPLAAEEPGRVEETLKLLAIIRLILPDVLLPATTALGTIDLLGRQRGLEAGANVVMPNLLPAEVRCKYELYDNKTSLGAESWTDLENIKKSIEIAGCVLDMGRGDNLAWKRS